MNPSTSPRIVRIGFLLAVAGGLLAVCPWWADAYTLPKLCALAVGATLAWVGGAGRPLRSTDLDRPLAALWLVMLASTLTSVDPPASVLGMYPQQFYGLLPLSLCTALYYAAAANGSAGAEDEAAASFVWTAAVVSAFGVVQRVAGRPILTPEILPAGMRITSTIGNPVMLGGVLVFLFPFALREAVEKRSPLGRAATALVVVALLLTKARGAWIGAALAAGAYLVLSGRVKLRAKDARAAGLVLALVAAPVFYVVQRGLLKGDSDSMRLEMIKASVPMLSERPLLGYGPDTYMIPFRRHRTDRWIRLSNTTSVLQLSAHNDLLQVAATLGWTGLAAYIWLLAAVFLSLKRRLSGRAGDGFGSALAAGLVGLFLQAKVNPITPSTIALAAIALGMTARREHSLPRAAGRAAAATTALALAAVTVLLGRLGYADRLFRRGIDTVNTAPHLDATFMAGVGDLKRATEIAPWSIMYLNQRCEIIFRVSRLTSKDQTRQLIDKALDLTAEGLRMHPGNPTAHELRSTALTLASRVGPDRLKEAMAEIKIASDMDPTLTFTLRRRMDLARALNDRDEFERAKAQYLRVIALTLEQPDWNPIVL